MLVNDDECDVANKPVSSQKCRGEDCSISSRFDIKDRNNSKRYKWKIGKWTQVRTQKIDGLIFPELMAF